MDDFNCYHCGDPCGKLPIRFDNKNFCCSGCQTVYQIFSEHELSQFYELQSAAGAPSQNAKGKFDFLSNAEIVEKLVTFNDGSVQLVDLFIPHIHCSSCIWILENLNKLIKGVRSSQVDFPKKVVSITYDTKVVKLKDIAELLARIGYEPHISLDDQEEKKNKTDRSLLYQLGVAGFAFGNVMLLSFPEYFEVEEFWLEQYKTLFRWLMFAFSIPVVFYAARAYFISAFKGLRRKNLNIDVPIALGIAALFLRSTIDIVFDWSSGFFDSLTGLVFFLLLGKFFQQKTYAFLSFERDYKSYFPIAVTRLREGKAEESVLIHDIKKGDQLLIRNEEVIPVDGILIKGTALIDYSFVTGESQPVYKEVGDKIYAGGKQLSGIMEMAAAKKVSQSYLTKLWSHSAFNEAKKSKFKTLTDYIAKRFTLAVLSIAVIATFFWLVTDPTQAFHVFTAVLIIACPCAIALAAPFTLGSMLRIFGKRKFYLKNADAIEQLAQVNAVVFDKTGTLTSTDNCAITYEGMELTVAEEQLMKTTLRASNHPLSRSLYKLLKQNNILTLDTYREELGKGILGKSETDEIRIGSSDFVGYKAAYQQEGTTVHVSSNNAYKGYFNFKNSYREGAFKVLHALAPTAELHLLSGDNDGERDRLTKRVPEGTALFFNQSPEGKLSYVKKLQSEGKKVMMVGDGLNDAGALAQSDIGIAVSENTNVFSPACDGILDAGKFQYLYEYIKASGKALKIIKVSFILSLLYNVIGLYYAVSGQLQPVVAAILMPLSSISIVAFTTFTTSVLNRKLK